MKVYLNGLVQIPGQHNDYVWEKGLPKFNIRPEKGDVMVVSMIVPFTKGLETETHYEHNGVEWSQINAENQFLAEPPFNAGDLVNLSELKCATGKVFDAAGTFLGPKDGFYIFSVESMPVAYYAVKEFADPQRLLAKYEQQKTQ